VHSEFKKCAFTLLVISRFLNLLGASRGCAINVRSIDFSRFKDQVTRSGLSIPSNIAEGFGRDTDKDKRNFLNYARGSCAELRTQIYIGIEIGYISSTAGKSWIKETKEISSMLTGLMKYLKF